MYYIEDYYWNEEDGLDDIVDVPDKTFNENDNLHDFFKLLFGKGKKKLVPYTPSDIHEWYYEEGKETNWEKVTDGQRYVK